MGSDVVISVNGGMNLGYSLMITGKNLVENEFLLKDSVYPFCHGIIIGTATLGHTDTYLIFLQQLDIRLATVLYSTI